MTASNTSDRSVSDDALASGGPAGDGGFDPSRPFTTRERQMGSKTLMVTSIVLAALAWSTDQQAQQCAFYAELHDLQTNEKGTACVRYTGEIIYDGPLSVDRHAFWTRMYPQGDRP